MIDNYLRTSLIFYDAAEKQDWRKTVLKNVRIPKAQVVERYRLPPFNITSTDLIGVPTVFKLYNKYTGIETADLLDPVYGGADLLSLEFDGADYWLIYDGETKLKTAMPCGEYIVKIGDCIKIWESETINICGIADNIINWREKNTIGMLYDTQERGNDYGVVVPDHSIAPQVYYYNNKSYCAWLQRGGAPWDCEAMVYAIYHKKCYISESYGVGEGTIGGADPHGYPAIIVADDGYIIVAHERLTGPGYPPDAHNGFLQIKRSDNPEDETSWTNAIAHNASHWQELGNEGAWRLTYPHFDKLPDGTIYLICRHSSAADLDRIVLFRSDDNGRTWNALGGNIDGGCDIVDINLVGGDEIYGFFGKHGNDNRLHVIVSWKDVGGANPPYELDIWYMRSEDNGVHWTDVSNSYIPDGPLGRNITSAGNNPIPVVDLNNALYDFVVESVDIPDYIGPRSCVVSDAKIPYILLGKGTKPAGPLPLFVYYWTGAAWVNTEPNINQFEPTYISSSHLFLRPNTTDVNCYEIILINKVDDIIKWRVYASNDLINWTLIYEYEWILLSDVFYMGSYTFNYINADYESLQFLVDTSPDYYDFYVRGEVDCICCQGLAKPITIEYENTHDFAGILSQAGYKGRVHLCADIRKPDQKIIKSGKERDGELWIQKIITQKIYRFNIICTESLIDTLTIIPSYETIIVHFDKESSEVKEFSVAPPEWKYEGLGQLEISFIVETVIKTNCDADYELQEEKVLNGDFSAWTGVYPNRDPDDWTITEVPNAEISEVAPNESHADAAAAGTGACNIYSPAAENVSLAQNILTIGKTYLVEIKITKVVNPGIAVWLGANGTTRYFSIEGIHRFVGICDGTNGFFYIFRNGACDITIDNVSVKLYS